MDNKQANTAEIFSGYKKNIIRFGYIFVTLALVADFLPALYVSITSGVFPSGGQLFQLWIAAAAAFGVGYIVQPVSFFPMVNMSGTFLVWLCGNVGEIRVPAATMAQNVTDCEQGSPKAEIMATLGIVGSIIVSVTMITVFAFIGAQVMPLLPKVIVKGFSFILPGVLGAVYASLCSKDFKLGVIILITSLVGIMVWPKLHIPGGMNMLLNIIVAVIVARIYYVMTKPKTPAAPTPEAK